MNRKLSFLAPLVATLALSGAALADAVPNFSGNWVLNTDKGQNLGMVKAISETVAVTQTPEKLTLDFSTTFMMKTTKRQVNYDLTGKTSVPNEGPMGDKAETLAKWDGGKLVVSWTTEGAVAGSKVVKTEIRSLSPDGKAMTVRTERAGKDPMELVYDKK
jgi:hypothetical protein